jgi:hypothetical protein
MRLNALVSVAALCTGLGCAAGDEPTWLLVELESLGDTGLRLMTPGSTPQVRADWQTVQPFAVRMLWVTPDGVREETSFGVGPTRDGGFLIAEDIEFRVDFKPGDEIGMIVSSIGRIDLRVTDARGRPAGVLADLGNWPSSLGGGRFFDRSGHRIVDLDPATEDAGFPEWVEDLEPIPHDDKTYIYRVGPFDGLMQDDRSLRTTARWLLLQSLGGGWLGAYDVRAQGSVVDALGNVVVPAEQGSVSWLGGDLFCYLRPDGTRIVRAGGELVRAYPDRYSVVRVPSNPDLVLFSRLDDDDGGGPVSMFWSRTELDFVGAPISARLYPAEDTSPWITFEGETGVGMMSADGRIIFRLAHFGPRPFKQQPGETRGRWTNRGGAYQGAALFSLETSTLAAVDGTHTHDSSTHWYLIDSARKVLWNSDGAPQPRLE